MFAFLLYRQDASKRREHAVNGTRYEAREEGGIKEKKGRQLRKKKKNRSGENARVKEKRRRGKEEEGEKNRK